MDLAVGKWDDQAAFFISQRSRLHASYKHDNVRFGMSLQDVARVGRHTATGQGRQFPDDASVLG